MYGIFVVLLIILLMLVASQLVVRYYSKASSDLVVEYNELDALQELKLSYGNLLVPASHYAVFQDKSDKVYFNTLIKETRQKLGINKTVVTASHDKSLLDTLESHLGFVEVKASEMFVFGSEGDISMVRERFGAIEMSIESGLATMDVLLDETKLEIDEYIAINNTVIRHSTITMLSLGGALFLFIILGGKMFTRSITRPIRKLVTTTKMISRGDRKVKVDIDRTDEFSTLTESFNAMVETLDSTTVSKNYLDNILNNMLDALIVTDEELKIQSVNKAALLMLGMNEDESTGLDIRPFFRGIKDPMDRKENSETALRQFSRNLGKMESIKTSSGMDIPVSVTSTVLMDSNNEAGGLILVVHDLTERVAIESKLEQVRKENLTDIYEAQEKERIRMATDLHDGLGQILTALSYSIQDMAAKAGSNEKFSGDEISAAQHQIDNAIREAKNLAHDLIPIVLKDFGLIVAIENLISRANEMYDATFRFEAFDFNQRIDPKREKALYRICQESVNNIVKHADADNATIQIFWQECSVVLVIEDDGAGFDPGSPELPSSHDGIGLISMRERVNAFNGTFTIHSTLGEGTELIVEIPCPMS